MKHRLSLLCAAAALTLASFTASAELEKGAQAPVSYTHLTLPTT